MEPCKECGAVLEEDADGFIKLRKPIGIPNEMMPWLAKVLYATLVAAAVVKEGKE